MAVSEHLQRGQQLKTQAVLLGSQPSSSGEQTALSAFVPGAVGSHGQGLLRVEGVPTGVEAGGREPACAARQVPEP